MLIYLPQLPVVVWLNFVNYPDGAMPLDIGIGIIQVCFLVVQGSYAWRAIRTIIGKQTADFITLCQLEATKQRQEALDAANAAAAPGVDAALRRRKRGLGASSRNLGFAGGADTASEADASMSSLLRQPPMADSPGLAASALQATTSSLPPLPPTATLAASRVGLRDVAREGIAGLGRATRGLGAQQFSDTSRQLAAELGGAKQ